MIRILIHAKEIMRFYIDSKHAPEDCGLANPDQGILIAPNWSERYWILSLGLCRGTRLRDLRNV